MKKGEKVEFFSVDFLLKLTMMGMFLVFLGVVCSKMFIFLLSMIATLYLIVRKNSNHTTIDLLPLSA